MSKQLNVDDINEQLLKVQRVWHEKLYSKVREDYEKHAEEKGKLSCAFSFGVSKHYAESDFKIMIVGQEANGHTCDYDNWDLEKWQKWAIAYLDCQLYDENYSEWKFAKNYSAFWSFIRTLKDKNFGVCWNNIDKVRRYVQTDGIAASEDYLLEQCDNDKKKDRSILHEKIFDGKSLLQREIEIAKPDIVIFAIGPTWPYYHSLSLALFNDKEVDDRLMKKYPQCKEGKYVCDITSEFGLNIPAFYTYHPTYLNRSGIWDNVVADVIKQINNLRKKSE